MIRLTIGNSESKIEGLSVSQYAELRGLLSYTIAAQASYFSGAHSNKRYLINKRGEFASGSVYMVQEFLKNIPHTVVDNRKLLERHKVKFNLSLGVTPYIHQVEAVKACLKHSRGVFQAPTGFGKSIFIALLIKELSVKSLILVPNLELKEQLKASLKEFFGNLDNITVENIDSSKLLKATDYGLLVLDESHHAAAKTYTNLNKKAWKDIFYRISCTATPFRSRDEENILLESITGKLIYSVSYKTAVENGYICPIEAYYVDLDAPEDELMGNYASVYKKGVVNNEELNAKVADILLKFHASKLSTLYIVKEIEHGNNLSNLTNAGFANGKSEDCRDLIKWFSSGKLKTLIATHGVAGEGVDTRACEYVIVAIPVKSKNLFMQIVGRSVRRYPGKETSKVILIKNNSHGWFKKAFKEQCKILADEYGIKAIKIDI